MRPRLEAVIGDWARQSLRFRWSALLDTAPVGPVDQPRYLNGVLVVEGIPSEPNQASALRLLDDLHALEQHFGRDRAGEERWGPRTLDLDLLFWGELRLDHPRWCCHIRGCICAPL